MLCLVIISTNGTVIAMSDSKSFEPTKDNRIITARLMDKDGNEVIEYLTYEVDDNKTGKKTTKYFYEKLPKSHISMERTQGVSDFSRYSVARSSSPIPCTSTVTGALNSYQRCFANAQSDVWIDTISVHLTSYYAKGSLCEDNIRTSPNGWNVLSYSNTHDASYTYTFGSAYAYFNYYDDSYDDVYHSRTWTK
jgi:hypothetical protein